MEPLRKEAKRWLRALRAGDAAASARFDRALPAHSAIPMLREVQQALAREQGFASWAALKEHHELSALGPDLTLEFLQRACIFSGSERDFPAKWQRAERIRVRHPEVARSSIHAAVVAGERELVAELIRKQPSLVHEVGGPQRWVPLLFACYGRLPNERAARESLAIARLLLDAGADPNSFFMSDEVYRFTALTGAMGQGEMGQPDHPHGKALARLLLERGAEPNDGQGLYNTCLVGDDASFLELLFEFGLDAEDLVNWSTENAPRTLDFLLAQAAKNGQLRRLRCLLEHGADPNARSSYDDKSCYEAAEIAGDRAVAGVLLELGATRRELQGADAFVSACMRGDEAEARRVVHPDYLGSSEPLIEAARRGNRVGVRLLLELGMDPNRPGKHGHLALHVSTASRELLELVLAHGADPRARCFSGSAPGWALHGGHLDNARFLAERSRSLLDAVATGQLALARELLEADPRALDERSPGGNGPLCFLPAEPEVARPLLELLIARGADAQQKNDEGLTPAQVLEAQGKDAIADLLEA